MNELVAMLEEEKRRLAAKRQELESQISEANEALLKLGERLRHVNGLLEPSAATEKEPRVNSQPRNRDIRDIAADILGEKRGEEMHYTKLAEEVEARGGDIPGINSANTLVARLVGDDRFVRPTRRGFYALRVDYPDAENVGARGQRESSNNGQSETP